jgi:Ice-binding-like
MKPGCIGLAALSLWSLGASATTINVGLGTASVYTILGGTTVTNSGVTNIGGNVGVGPGGTVGGFPPGIVTGGGVLDGGDPFSMAAATQAVKDLTTAYNYAAKAACGTVIATDLGGLTLTPGSYCFSSSAQLTGKLTLDNQGNPNAVFLFQIGTTLTTADGSSVVFVNGKGNIGSVYWQVGSSATIGSTSAFAGNILAAADITLDAGSTILCGRALSETGTVTMDTNDVNDLVTKTCDATPAVPEPGTAGPLILGLLFIGLILYRQQTRKHAAKALPPR